MEFIAFITTPPLQGMLGTPIPSKIERKEISAEDFADAIAQIHAEYVGTKVEVFQQGSGRTAVKTTTWSDA